MLALLENTISVQNEYFGPRDNNIGLLVIHLYRVNSGQEFTRIRKTNFAESPTPNWAIGQIIRFRFCLPAIGLRLGK